jgi:hypothetical protein
MDHSETPVVVVAATDADDLNRMLADDVDIEERRQAIADRHAMDAHPAVQLALSRISGHIAAMDVEVRFIRRHLGGE